MNRRVLVILVVGLFVISGLLIYLRYCASNIRSSRVVFFNVGQGDSALIDFGNGQKMLVDCGPDRKILSKLGQYLPFYDRTIDYLLISHPDLDHYGGCVDVLRRYDVKNIIENGATKSDPYFQVWDKYRHDEGAHLQTISGAQTKHFGSSTLEFLSPDPNLNMPAKDREGNNLSIVFRLIQGDKTILFVGDAEVPLESALVQKYCVTSSTCPALRADYLKVGHHGSDSSSSDGMLSVVAPSVAIISVGKNTFGHPSFRVMKHLERIGADIWRTDEKNDIIIGD